MKLKKVQVQMFRHMLDSTVVEIQDDVTCLVGKNESGKTTFLEALWRLNPANGNPDLDITKQYPAWLEKKHRREGRNLEGFEFVQATFALDEGDHRHVAERIGEGVLTCGEITVSRRYDEKTLYKGVTVDEAVATKHLANGLDLPASFQQRTASCTTIEGLQALAAEAEQAKDSETAGTIRDSIEALIGDNTVHKAAINALHQRLPKFFYFRDYSRLPDTVRIRELLQADRNQLSIDQQTARALLDLAGAEDDYLLNPDYNRRKRELENVANALSQDVLEYWTTNRHLRVLIDISMKTEAVNKGHQAVVDELLIRMYDDSHMLSLPFGGRSSGFQWFFSFLAAFSAFEASDEPVVILLDEPGLGLHAKAQKDFLKFIDERLSKRTVIYTTHSPFMVQPNRLERARLVQDRGTKIGSTVTDDILTTDQDTLFPLQGALGYDLAQHLLPGNHNIVVEGASDHLYLSVISDHLTDQGRTGLDPKWSIVAVGGADLIPTFVALLGIHLDVTPLIDSRKQGNQRLLNLAKDGYLKETRIVTIGEILARQVADIEDLFKPEDYVRLYNKAFGKSLTTSDLTGADSIVSQIARHERVDRFNHNKPAEVLLRDRALVASLDTVSLSNFEKLFERLNKTMQT